MSEMNAENLTFNRNHIRSNMMAMMSRFCSDDNDSFQSSRRLLPALLNARKFLLSCNLDFYGQEINVKCYELIVIYNYSLL